MSLRDLFAVESKPMLHVAAVRECNMQHQPCEAATSNATLVPHARGKPCVPTLSDATHLATLVQHAPKTTVAHSQVFALGNRTRATPADGSEELSQDLPLLAALAEFDALIERLCDLRNHPADVREQMRQVLRRMAPYNVPGELDAVRELVKQAEAGDLSMLSDDRITCRNCWKRAPNGICGIAKPGGIVNAKVGYIPDALLQHRCPGFIPKTVGGDQRTGAERWPDLGIDDL